MTAQQLQHMGLAAPWHVESSQTRDQTCVPCIGMHILNHLDHQNSPPEVFFKLEVFLLKIEPNYLISFDIYMCKAL